MYGFRHIYQSMTRRSSAYQPLYLLGSMLLFWIIFDSTLAYIAPLLMAEQGFSRTVIGLVLGSSSVFGALFDILLSRYLANAHYRRIFYLMFAVCFIYPLILWQAKTISLFLVAMAAWSFYYNLHNFGDFDFIARTTKRSESVASFSIVQIFQEIGFLLAPIIAGLAISELVGWRPFAIATLFLIASFMVFLALVRLMAQRNGTQHLPEITVARRPFIVEMSIWQKVGRQLLPLLLVSLLLNIIDAFMWTLGPLYAESQQVIGGLNGVVISAYALPSILLGVFIGSIARHFGSKRTLYGSVVMALLFFGAMGMLPSVTTVILAIFLASCFIAIAWPVVNSLYTSFITREPHYEREIESVQDFFTNVGYIIGPMIAGVLADTFNLLQAFSAMALIGLVIVYIAYRLPQPGVVNQ